MVVKPTLFKSCTIYFENPGCVPYLKANSQNVGSFCKISHYNEPFDIKRRTSHLGFGSVHNKGDDF